MKSLTIASNTFLEAVRQPFYLLVVATVVVLIVLHYFLPFFTLSEQDILMYKDVCLAYILMGLLVTALLTASKVIDEEIENRTMLTLMSKPVRRWELIVGKFAGVIAAVTAALIVCAATLAVATYLRVPTEVRINANTLNQEQYERLAALRYMHVMSLLPAFVLIWLQIAVMTSISVAISTRAGLVINLVAGVGIFIAAHLAPMLGAGPSAGRPGWQRGLAATLVAVLPGLENFNLNKLLIYSDIVFGGQTPGPGQVAWLHVWYLTGLAALYAAAYVLVALLAAMALFRTRELG